MKLNILSQIRHECGGRITNFHAGQDNSVEFTVEFSNGYTVFIKRITGTAFEPNYYTFWITYQNSVAGSFIGAETCMEEELLPILSNIAHFE